MLATLHRRAPLIVQQALYWDEECRRFPASASFPMRAASLQGDHYAIEIDLEPDTQAHVTTHGQGHPYSGNGREFRSPRQNPDQTRLARIPISNISPPDHSRCKLLPFRAANREITIHPTASALIYSEVLMAGRKCCGTGETDPLRSVLIEISCVHTRMELRFSAEKFIVEPARGICFPRALARYAGFIPRFRQSHPAHAENPCRLSAFRDNRSGFDMDEGIAWGQAACATMRDFCSGTGHGKRACTRGDPQNLGSRAPGSRRPACPKNFLWAWETLMAGRRRAGLKSSKAIPPSVFDVTSICARRAGYLFQNRQPADGTVLSCARSSHGGAIAVADGVPSRSVR